MLCHAKIAIYHPSLHTSHAPFISQCSPRFEAPTNVAVAQFLDELLGTLGDVLRQCLFSQNILHFDHENSSLKVRNEIYANTTLGVSVDSKLRGYVGLWWWKKVYGFQIRNQSVEGEGWTRVR